MKYIRLFLLSIILLEFSSCKKDYTCTCTDSSGFKWAEYTINHLTEKKAKDACSAHDSELTSVSATCVLK